MSIDRKLGELQLDMGVYRFLRLSIDGYRFFKQREKEVCGVFQLLESVAAGIKGSRSSALKGAMGKKIKSSGRCSNCWNLWLEASRPV